MTSVLDIAAHPDDIDLGQLRAAAETAAEGAYAPYSGFQVGAALLSADGTVVTGCNVENASFGLTICAERAAVFSAVGAGRAIRFRALVVVTIGDRPCPPCGACRQVLFEFSPDAVVGFDGPDGPVVTTVRSLTPHAFVLPM